jgi:hypothetical protein
MKTVNAKKFKILQEDRQNFRHCYYKGKKAIDDKRKIKNSQFDQYNTIAKVRYHLKYTPAKIGNRTNKHNIMPRLAKFFQNKTTKTNLNKYAAVISYKKRYQINDELIQRNGTKHNQQFIVSKENLNKQRKLAQTEILHKIHDNLATSTSRAQYSKRLRSIVTLKD